MFTPNVWMIAGLIVAVIQFAWYASGH